MDGGVGCEPPPLRVDCPPGSFAVPTGECTQVWECPEGWHRCAPPPLPEDCPAGRFVLPDGTCSERWLCPENWRQIEDEPPVGDDGEPLRPRVDIGCEPIYDDCPEGLLARPGGGCDDFASDDCGAGPWGDHDWPGGTLYVAAGASPEGVDGSREHPYPTVVEAVAAAEPGATVASPCSEPLRWYSRI